MNDKLMEKIRHLVYQNYRNLEDAEQGAQEMLALISQERERLLKEIEKNIMKLPTVPQYTEIGKDGTLPPSKPSEWVFMKRKDLVKALSDIGGGE